MMGWGENWNAARVNTNTEYFGKLTCARRVALEYVAGENRYVLIQHPVIEIENSEDCWRRFYPDEDKEVIYDNGYMETFSDGGRKVYSKNKELK